MWLISLIVPTILKPSDYVRHTPIQLIYHVIITEPKYLPSCESIEANDV